MTGTRQRARRAVTRVRRELLDHRSARRTALRVPPEQAGPAPGEYAGFGPDAWIVPPVRVRNPGRIHVGAGIIVLEHSTLAVLDDGPGGPLLVLGAGTRLARFCLIVCEVGVEIGEEVSSSDSATVLDTWRVPDAPGDRRPFPPPAPVVIERGAYLGCNSIVGPGVRVGEGAFVGEGAVVLDDVPAHSVVYGNPAVVTRRHDEPADAWKGPRLP